VNAQRIGGLMTAVIIVAVLGLGWLLGVAPLLAAARDADEQRVAAEATNLAQEATLVELRAKFDNVDEYRLELEELRETLPASSNIEAFYAQLSRTADDVEVLITGITTGQPRLYGTNDDGSAVTIPEGSVAAAPALTGRAAEALYVVPVSITLQNKPNEVVDFVGALQRSTRVILVTNVAFVGGYSGAPSGTITAYIFVMHDPSYDPDAPKVEETPAPEPTDSATATPSPTPTP